MYSNLNRLICGIALVLAIVFATSCGNQQKESVAEEAVIETIDSTAVVSDTIQTESDTIVSDTITYRLVMFSDSIAE